jgi:hypothetical protein
VREKIILKSSAQKFELKLSLIGPLSKLYVMSPPSILLHPRWMVILFVEISLNGKKENLLKFFFKI